MGEVATGSHVTCLVQPLPWPNCLVQFCFIIYKSCLKDRTCLKDTPIVYFHKHNITPFNIVRLFVSYCSAVCINYTICTAVYFNNHAICAYHSGIGLGEIGVWGPIQNYLVPGTGKNTKHCLASRQWIIYIFEMSLLKRLKDTEDSNIGKWAKTRNY